MTSINVAEAKAKMSQLLDRASAGEKMISRAGKPVARLVAVDVAERRKPGAWRGRKAADEALLAPMDQEDLDGASYPASRSLLAPSEADRAPSEPSLTAPGACFISY
jgi:prevent-host-death family protein